MDGEPAKWEQCVEHAALSDVGLRRANNQDSIALAMATSREKWHQRGHLFMVADGMGAHAAGELASKLATDSVPLTYHKLQEKPAPEALIEAIRDANSFINSRGQANDEFKGMGTTVDTLVVLPEGAIVGHVGDSRTYRWRDNRLDQLTFDHSLVWEMRAAGQIPEDEVPNYVPKNIITRSMGPNPQVKVDLEGPLPLEVGDTFFLCSDGLSGQVEDEEIGQILGSLAPKEAVRALVDLANLRGGPDNITVIVVRVCQPCLDVDPPCDPPSEGAGEVHPVLWGALGGFVALTLIMGVMAIAESTSSSGVSLPQAGAAIGLIGVVVSAILVIARRFGGRKRKRLSTRPLGQGPYKSIDCPADAEFVETLGDIAGELRDAATSEQWSVDWEHFDLHEKLAAEAAQKRDYALAIREHFNAVSYMMDELKSQRSRRDSVLDTDVDVF